jgi:hypothetical protein
MRLCLDPENTASTLQTVHHRWALDLRIPSDRRNAHRLALGLRLHQGPQSMVCHRTGQRRLAGHRQHLNFPPAAAHLLGAWEAVPAKLEQLVAVQDGNIGPALAPTIHWHHQVQHGRQHLAKRDDTLAWEKWI